MEVELRNGIVSVLVRPDLGGRIDQITDLATQKKWLWHPDENDASRSRTLLRGSSFDVHWTGGWDDIFPNDAAGDFEGRTLYDHGELWSQPWELLEQDARLVKLRYTCESLPVVVEKTVGLDPHRGSFQISYRFENLSGDVLPFLFKAHPALAIEEGDELLLPECEVEPVELGFSRIIGKMETTRFPLALDSRGGPVSLNRALGAETEAREFFYCSALKSGVCGLFNRRTGTRLQIKFDIASFPFVWVFQSYRGFRGHYVMILEPSTTKPYDLLTAWNLGTTPVLKSRELRRYSLSVEIT